VTVIADTSPLQYAVEIDVAPSIFMLYGRIVVPAGGFFRNAPSRRSFVAAPLGEGHQEEIQVRFVQVPDDPRLALLDLGDRCSSLTMATGARKLGAVDLRITGLLGVIRDAALRGFLNFDEALQKLRSTDFRLSPEVEAVARRQYREQAR